MTIKKALLEKYEKIIAEHSKESTKETKLVQDIREGVPLLFITDVFIHFSMFVLMSGKAIKSKYFFKNLVRKAERMKTEDLTIRDYVLRTGWDIQISEGAGLKEGILTRMVNASELEKSKQVILQTAKDISSEGLGDPGNPLLDSLNIDEFTEAVYEDLGGYNGPLITDAPQRTYPKNEKSS